MFKQTNATYQKYIDLGIKGGTYNQFFDLLAGGAEIREQIREQIENKNTEWFAADRHAVGSYAMGLIVGNHLDKFRYFYNKSLSVKSLSDESFAKDIIVAGLHGAVIAKNLYLFEEIKEMAFLKDVEGTFRAIMKKESTNTLAQLDALMKETKPPYELINDVNKQIKKVEEDGGINEAARFVSEFHSVEWNDDTSRYPDKHRVLTEVKKYLLGASNITQLTKVVEDNPKYDKGSAGRTETGKLLDRAKEYKNDTLTQAPKNR